MYNEKFFLQQQINKKNNDDIKLSYISFTLFDFTW